MTPEQIEAAVDGYGLQPLPSGTPEKFASYLSLLLKWNARLNLTAIREPESIVQRQFLECIFLAHHLPSGIETLLDFGSGGGFPGIPIALCCPGIKVTLAESQGKKAAFLQEAVRLLQLKADVYNGRVETLDRQFNAVALRAVDKMQEACIAAGSKILPNGWLLLFSTESSKPQYVSLPGSWTWQPSIKLRGLDQGILLFGHKLPDVPRGTSDKGD